MLNEKRPDWFDDASCRGLDIKLFCPERHQPQLIKEARAICAECPVQAECREYSLDLHETYEIFGVWVVGRIVSGSTSCVAIIVLRHVLRIRRVFGIVRVAGTGSRIL